jgi:predicted nucleic acid-binding protein
MEYLVLDTDVASHLQRGSLPQELQAHLQGKTPCVTFVTVGEFFKGAFRRGWGERRIEGLETWLRNVVILPYTGEVSRTWGRVHPVDALDFQGDVLAQDFGDAPW